MHYMDLILRTLATAVSLGVAAFLIPGIAITGDSPGAKALTLVIVAVVVGLVYAFVKPLVQFVSGCFILLTFGLFLLVINAGLLAASAWAAQQLGFGFYVDGFWAALFGSIVVSLVNGIMDGALGVGKAAD